MHDDSYQDFYKKYRDKLISYLTCKSRDPDLAEEVTQETFARHFQNYGVKAIGVPSLLYVIARNILIDHQRAGNLKISLEETSEQAGENQEAQMVSRLDTKKILHAIQQLGILDREVLTLAVQGVSYKEIAEQKKISLANVKVRIHRARKKVKQLCQEEEREWST